MQLSRYAGVHRDEVAWHQSAESGTSYFIWCIIDRLQRICSGTWKIHVFPNDADEAVQKESCKLILFGAVAKLS